MPPTRLIVLELIVSLTSAEPRRARPRRTPVKAFGRLVRTASSSIPMRTVRESDATGRAGARVHHADAAKDDGGERRRDHERGSHRSRPRRCRSEGVLGECAPELPAAPPQEDRVPLGERDHCDIGHEESERERECGPRRDDPESEQADRDGDAARHPTLERNRLAAQRHRARGDGHRPIIAPRLKSSTRPRPRARCLRPGDERCDGRAELRRVRAGGGEQSEQRLGQAEPLSEAVEPVGEDRRRE